MSSATAAAAAEVPHIGREHISPRDAVVDALVIARRNLIRVVRLPQLLILSVAQPVMFLVLFNYVFGGAVGQSLPDVVQGKYINFLLPGLMVQISVFGAGQTALGLTEDLSKGVIERFRSLPMARSAVLAGRTLADVFRNTIVMSLMLVIAYLIGFRWQTDFLGFLGGFALVMVFSYTLSWVMATIGLLVKNPRPCRQRSSCPCSPSCSPAPCSSRRRRCPAGCRPSPTTSRSPSSPTRSAA